METDSQMHLGLASVLNYGLIWRLEILTAGVGSATETPGPGVGVQS
jgi:hypothetical protein